MRTRPGSAETVAIPFGAEEGLQLSCRRDLRLGLREVVRDLVEKLNTIPLLPPPA